MHHTWDLDGVLVAGAEDDQVPNIGSSNFYLHFSIAVYWRSESCCQLFCVSLHVLLHIPQTQQEKVSNFTLTILKQQFIELLQKKHHILFMCIYNWWFILVPPANLSYFKCPIWRYNNTSAVRFKLSWIFLLLHILEL